MHAYIIVINVLCTATYRHRSNRSSSHNGDGSGNSTCNRNTKLMECWITHFLRFVLFCCFFSFVFFKLNFNWEFNMNGCLVGYLHIYVHLSIKMNQLRVLFFMMYSNDYVCVFLVCEWWQIVKEFWVFFCFFE